MGGWLLSEVLVKILTGVFDPPPDVLAIPWSYLTLTIAVAVSAVTVAAAFAVRDASKPQLSVLRDI
jgi:putative ABC transport system permease protein